MCRSATSRSPGFTLVELLVVMAIIGTLVALLLPAVQSARESARMSSCQNNLKQVGLALQNYESSKGVFPPSSTSKPRRHSWVPFVLPFLEEGPLHSRYRWDKHWDHKANQPVVNTHLHFLRCPSVPDGPELIDKVRSGITAATSDYAPPSGFSATLERVGLVPSTSDRRGVMTGSGGVPIVLIRDGTSSTLLIVEDAGRPVFWTKRGYGPAKNDPGCGNFPVDKGRVRGAGWADNASAIPLHGFTEDGLRCPGACPINCTNNNEAFSFHVSGVNVVFADGSVQLLSENTEIGIYAALITRAGSEVISAGAF